MASWTSGVSSLAMPSRSWSRMACSASVFSLLILGWLMSLVVGVGGVDWLGHRSGQVAELLELPPS